MDESRLYEFQFLLFAADRKHHAYFISLFNLFLLPKNVNARISTTTVKVG